MRPSLRAIPLLVAGLAMADLDSHPLALTWPVVNDQACEQTSTDPFHEFGFSQHTEASDAQGRPLSMLRVIVNRHTEVDSTEMSIAWTPELPVERNRFTRQPYSFPLRILYRTANSAGIAQLDTLEGIWDTQHRTLTYTATMDLKPSCGWHDSIAFDELFRPIEQTTCGNSTPRIHSIQRFHYEGADRHPRSSATIMDSAHGETDSAWVEGPTSSPSRGTSLQIITRTTFGTKSISRRLETTDYRYGPDGKLQGLKTVTTQDSALAGISDTWITWGSTGTWDKLEGFEVAIGTTRDSLWWSATCSDIPSAIRVHKEAPKTRSSRLVRGNSGWILLTDHTPIGPVEWIGADGMRSTVQVSSRAQGLQLHWRDNSRPGWIRFRTSSGAELIPTSGLVR